MSVISFESKSGIQISESKMPTPLDDKSTVDEIRERFDRDVDRFSQLGIGQSATIDARLVMDLIAKAAVACTSPIKRVLDIGCGAGNNSLRLRQVLGEDFVADLLDLSQPMLDRAVSRLSAINNREINALHGDFRSAKLQADSYDVIIAAAVLHHLREDTDWLEVFEKIFSLLAAGGSVWITDLVAHETRTIDEIMWAKYGEYLVSLDGERYRDKVFAYIDKEDSPRPVTYQLELLRSVGFSHIELLHKNLCFAAFGAVKSA